MNQNPQSWNYEQAFSRHLGVFTPEEQNKLRKSRVAITGLGGVGGVHMITLARMGVGAFNIVDFDRFELSNFNRQYGATIPALGRFKTEVMAELAKNINPELDIRIFNEPISEKNIEAFLKDVDVLVDALDFYVIDARRIVFQEARKRGIWCLTAGPHAFSTGWLLFSPTGMSFDEYFDFHDGMSTEDKIAAFTAGLVPHPIHLAYLDLKKYFRPEKRAGSSVGAGCQLASGVVGSQVAKILLKKHRVEAVPHYFQFDAYRGILKRGYMPWGNRNPRQLLFRWWLKKSLTKASRQQT